MKRGRIHVFVGILGLTFICGYFLFRPAQKPVVNVSSSSQEISTLIRQAADLQKEQKSLQAAKKLEQALGLQRKYFPDNSVLEVRLLGGIANDYCNGEDFKKSTQWFEEAISVQQKERSTSAVLAGLYNDLGVIKLKQQKYPDAEALFQKSIVLIKQTKGEHDPYTAAVLNNLAGLYTEQGMYDKAETLAKEAIDLLKHKYGETDPDVIALQENYEGLQQKLRTSPAAK